MRPSSPPVERSPLGRQTPSRAWTTPVHRTLFDSHLEATEGGVTPIESPSFRRQFSNAGTSFRSQLEPTETGITTAETTFTSRLAQDGSSFRSQLEATETGIAPVERTFRCGTPCSERGATLRSHLEAAETGVIPTYETSFRPQVRVSEFGTSFHSELEPSEGGITPFDRTYRTQIQVPEPGRTVRSELEVTRGGITPFDRTYRTQIQIPEPGQTVRSELEATRGGITPFDRTYRTQIQIPEPGQTVRSELEATRGGITPFDRTYRTQIQIPEPGQTVRSELEATRGGITPFDRTYRTQIQIPEPGQTVRSELEATRGGITPFDRTYRTQIQIPEPGQTVRSELEATRGGITPFDRTYRTQIQIPEPGQTVRSELEATRGGITPFDRTYRTQIQISEPGRTVRSELEAMGGGVTPIQRTPFRPHIKLSGIGTTFRSHLEPSEGGIAPSERTPFRPRSGPPGDIRSDRRYQRSRSQPSRARASPAVGTPEEYSQPKSRRTQSPCVCPSNRRQTYIRSYPTVGRRRVRHTPQQKSVAGNVDDYQEFLQADLPQGVEELLDTTAEFEETENTIQFEENERLIGEVSNAFQQLGGQIDAGSPACQVCRPCTPSGSSSAQVSDSGHPTSAPIVRRRKSKEVVRHRKSREKISRPAKSQMPSNRRMRQGVTSSSARFPKPIASSTPLKTPAPGRPRSMSPTVGRSPRQELQRGAGACGVCPPAHQQSESRQGPSHQLDDLQVPQTGSVSQKQRRNVPFTSDLSPERPRYPVPQTRIRHIDIISGITSDVRDPEEPPPPFHEEEPPGSLDRTMSPHPQHERQWIETEVALTQVEMDAEREAQDEMRRIHESLGPGVDEFQMVEALIEHGVPEEVVSRRMEGAGRISGDEQDEREQRYFSEVERMVQEEADDVDIALMLSRLELESRPYSEISAVPTLNITPRRRMHTLRRQLREMRRQTQSFTIVEGEEPEDIQPEVAAAMMYTEERGLRLGDAPQQMFSYLFRVDPSTQSSVNLMPVQSGVDESLVVPMKLQPQFSSTLNLAEVQSGIQQQPSTSLYSETVGNATYNVGAARQEQELSSIPAGPSTADQQAVGGVDYVLKPKRPTHSSYVQLRGSQPPSWFPGYFEAVPTSNEGLRISHSPSNVMQNAWQYTHPSWYDPYTMVFTDRPEPSEIADIPEIQVNS